MTRRADQRSTQLQDAALRPFLRRHLSQFLRISEKTPFPENGVVGEVEERD